MKILVLSENLKSTTRDVNRMQPVITQTTTPMRCYAGYNVKLQRQQTELDQTDG